VQFLLKSNGTIIPYREGISLLFIRFFRPKSNFIQEPEGGKNSGNKNLYSQPGDAGWTGIFRAVRAENMPPGRGGSFSDKQLMYLLDESFLEHILASACCP
jgi:hypothetical protein